LLQINAIRKYIDLFSENKFIPSKQNAAQSGVEQPIDLCCVFKGIKSEIASHLVTHFPADRCLMKKLMMNMFERPKFKSLTLKPNKKMR
jgi:hypothetical protein